MKKKVIISICILLIAILLIESVWMIKTRYNTNTPYQPVKAYNPNPPERVMNASPMPILKWKPGKNAVKHDVYFSGDMFAVYNATRQNPRGVLVSQGQDTNFYTVEKQLGSMARGYWRIDEIDSHGNIITGDLWGFQVHEYKGRFCFTGLTPVWIDGKTIAISEAGIGQNVGGTGKVEEVQEHEGTFTVYDVLLDSGNCISVAENHYFMTESGQWLSLHDLKAGTRLKTSKTSIGIKSVTKQLKPYIGKVYNLKIEGSDQYMVGEDAVIVRDY